MATSRTKECSRLKEKCITAPSTPQSYLGRRRLPRMSIPGSPDRNFPEKPIASFRRPTISSSLHTSAVPDKPHYPPFITGLAKHPPPRKPPEKFSTLRQPRITYTSISSFNERPPRTPSSFAKFCSGQASSSGKSEWSSELKRKRKEVNEYIPRISSVPEIVLQEEKEPTREIEMEEVEIVSIASIEEHLLPEELPDPEPDLVEPKVLDVIIDSAPQTEDHLSPIIEQCEPSSLEDDQKDEEIKECSNESEDVAVAEGSEEPQVEEGGDGERQEDEIEKTIVVESGSTLPAEPESETVLDEVLEQSSIVSTEIAEAVQKQEQELKKEEEEGKEETVTMKASTSQAEPENQETVQKAEERPEKAKAEKVAVAVAAAEKKPEAVQGRKKEGAKSNDVIEETKTKLMGMRRNKVLALVGAFETVMQLHEPEA